MKGEVQIEDRPDAPTWGVDAATMARWAELTPGTAIEIAKWSAKHDGAEQARYPAQVIASDLPGPWVVFEAHWIHGTVEQAALTFENGDILHEIFSPIHPYNAFAVFAPSGELKGWYGNVTWPAFFAPDGDTLTLVWDDLYIDIVACPDGRVAVEDEDELEESGLATADPELHRRILIARDELLARFHDLRPPFRAPHRIETEATP